MIMPRATQGSLLRDRAINACTRRGAYGPGRGLGTLAAAGLFALASPAAAQSLEPDRVPGMAVSVTPARALCFEARVDVSGTVVPRHEFDVAPDREGLQVSQTLVDTRDEVTPGQVLARLVPSESQGGAAPVALRSPVAGIVESSQASPDVPASPRQPLFRILGGGELDLQAEATSADLLKVAVGQPVTVTPLGASDLSGTVQAILPAVSPQSQLGRLRIAMDGGHEIRVGTFAHGRIVVGRRCGLGVPSSAVLYPPDGTVVQVVVGKQVQARRVAVGLASGRDLEIVSGLKEHEVVVVRAGPFLRDGEQVSPIPVDTPGAE